MSRKVNRRFLPLSPDFNVNWKIEEVIQTFNEKEKKEVVNSDDDDAIDD
jgi:hypothetical protein